MKVLDAVQYLKNSKFAENSQYEWINPILQKVLNNDFTNMDTINLISNITKRQDMITNNVVEETSASLDKDLNISKIMEISEIKNYGLLDLKEPIVLKDGLNIFYGENGVGKSSLFKAICDVFELYNHKKCVPNIYKENDEKMKCKLKIKDKDNNVLIIDGSENYSKPDNIKVFDNYISNYIVTNDQKNEFEIPYLKQQYFYVLRNVLEEVDEELSKAIENIENEINNNYEMLENDYDFSNINYKQLEQMITGVEFTEADTEELNKLEKEKTLLETDITAILNMSYSDRKDEVDLILEEFFNKEIERNQYILKYNNNYCKKYNEDLDKYYNLKRMYEENSITNLKKYIQEDRINNKKWIDFIFAGIDFIKTLNEEEQELYTNEVCPYCNQELNDKSKELLKMYKNVRNTQKKEIEVLENKFKLQKDELEQVIQFINNEIEKFNNNINKIIIDEKQEKLIDINIDEFKKVFSDMLASVKDLKKMENIDFKYFEEVVNEYIKISVLIEEYIEKTSLTIKGKNNKIEKLNEKIKVLNMKKIITKNFTKLNKIVEDLKIKEDINYKKRQLTSLKRTLSRLENSFASESSMKIFLERLHKEYEELKLTPPSQFSLKPKKEKRQIRIGEYKISDIYSEGELKIHSLAEFFAEAEINNVKGIYIFDDPVNSLDYERIGYVKERIMKLVNDGNQVIVFTHNIYFLNSLVETDKEKINRITKANNQVYVMQNTVLGERDSEIKRYGDKIRSKILSFEKNSEEIDKYEIASVYDLMSGCLECYVENKLLKGLIGRYRPNIRMYSLLELKKLDAELIDDIFNLYNTASRYCNRHSSPIEEIPADLNKLKSDYELFKKITGLK